MLSHLESQKISEEALAKELYVNKISVVFEVIIPDFDPHIIKYDQAKLVLLDVIHNTISKFVPYNDEMRGQFCKTYGFTSKTLYSTINNWDEFKLWYDKISDPEFSIGTQYVEGFVIQDADHFMVKFKLSYYKMWKIARGLKDKIAKGKRVKVKEVSKELKEFIMWLQTLDKAELKSDIITLRSKWKVIKDEFEPEDFEEENSNDGKQEVKEQSKN